MNLRQIVEDAPAPSPKRIVYNLSEMREAVRQFVRKLRRQFDNLSENKGGSSTICQKIKEAVQQFVTK